MILHSLPSRWTTWTMCALFASSTAIAQQPRRPQTPGDTPATPSAAAAPAAGPSAGASKPGPKAYKDVITSKAVTRKGLFTVHKVDDKYYFEIPDAMFGREMMAVTRFSRVAGGAGVYGGELANQQVVRFEKGPYNKVFMRVVTVISVANDSTQPIYKAVRNSNLDPIAAAFDVKSAGKDSNGVVLDVTDFFKGDNQPVSINSMQKRRFNLGGIMADRSYIENINSFPIRRQ